MSKIGLHSVIGPKTGVGVFLQRIADAGQTLAVVKCVDQFAHAKFAFAQDQQGHSHASGIGQAFE